MTETTATALVGPRQVYDADLDKFVERTEAQMHRAAELLENIAGAEITKGVSLAEFVEDRHFLDFGFSSMTAFREAMMPDVTQSTLERLLKIGRRFRPVLAAAQAAPMGLLEAQKNGDRYTCNPSPVTGLDAKSPNPAENQGSNCNDGDGGEASITEIGALGMRKLLALTRLDEECFEEVVSRGTLVTSGGESYTLADLQRMKTSQMEEMVREHTRERRAYQGRAQRLESEIRKIKAEQKADADAVREAREKADEAFRLECLYGPARNDFEGLKHLLALADDHLILLRQALMNVGPRIEDHRALSNKLQAVVSAVNVLAHEARVFHAEALSSAADAPALWAMDAMIDDVLKEEGFTNLDGSDTAEADPEDAAMLAAQGWRVETRQNDEGFSETRLVNALQGTSTTWCATFDVAVARAKKVEVMA